MFTVVLTKDGNLPAARAALDKLIAGLATEPFKDEELQRVKSQELNGYERLMSNSEQVAFNLSENVAAGEKAAVPLDELPARLDALLGTVQATMLETARARREANSLRGPITYDRFREVMDGDGAFVYAGWCGDAACEAAVKEETRATIRVLPDPEFRSVTVPERCLKCGRAATTEAVWAKAY